MEEASVQRLKAAWIEVRTGVRRCLQEFELRDAERLGDDSSASADEPRKRVTNGRADIPLESLKADVDLLCEHDPHQLMRRLESISHEHIMKMKVQLWTMLVSPEKQPELARFFDVDGAPESDERKFEQARLFLRALLDRFSTFQESIHHLTDIFATLDEKFLSLFGISWKVINHHIFDDIIYQEFLRKYYVPLNIKVFNIPALSDDKEYEEPPVEEVHEETLEQFKNRTDAKLRISLKHLHKLMVTCRMIFQGAEFKIRNYAERGVLPEHPKERKRRLIAEDQAFFLSQRRLMRSLAEHFRTEGSNLPPIEDCELSENEDAEDDREFMSRLHQLVDNGLSLAPVCPGGPGYDDLGEQTKHVKCERCSQHHCCCDACLISHTIVCGLFTAEESSNLLAADQESTGSGDEADIEDDHLAHSSFSRMLSSLGSNIFNVHRSITNDEHLANIHNDWEMTDESGVEAGSNSDSTSQKSSTSTEDVSSGSPVTHSLYAKEKPDDEASTPVPSAIPKTDGCAKLNEQLSKDLAMIKGDGPHRVIKCLPGTENMAVWCCLFHRNDYRRQLGHAAELSSLMDWEINNSRGNDESREDYMKRRPKQKYRFSKLFQRVWLRRCKDDVPKMPLSEFAMRMECDRQRADIYKRALEIVGEKIAGQTRIFYKQAQSEVRRSVEERLMKEAAEACRIITERADNRQACNWSTVHDHIRSIRDWQDISFGRSEKHLVCTLYEYEVAMLAGLPRRGLAFFLMRSLYHSALGGRLRHFKVDVAGTEVGTPICDKSYRCRCDITCTSRMEQTKLTPLYEASPEDDPVPNTETDYTLVGELKTRSRHEALWTAIVVSHTEILECPDLGRLIDLSYLIAEAICFQFDESRAKNIPYDPVKHFKALCPIYNTLDDCGHLRKPRYHDIDEALPNPNNPHSVSSRDMRTLDELGFPAFLVAELTPELVTDILRDPITYAPKAHELLKQVTPAELRTIQENLIPQSVDYGSSIDDEDEPFPTRTTDIFCGPSHKVMQLRKKLKKRREQEAVADQQPEKLALPAPAPREEIDPRQAEEEAERIAASLDAGSNASALAKALKRQRQKERKTAQKKAAEEERRLKEDEERLKREEAERKKQEQKLAARQRMDEARKQKELEDQKKKAAAEVAKAKAKAKTVKKISQSQPAENFVIEEPDFGPVKLKVEQPPRQRTKSPEPAQKSTPKSELKLESKKSDAPKGLPKAVEVTAVGKATRPTAAPLPTSAAAAAAFITASAPPLHPMNTNDDAHAGFIPGSSSTTPKTNGDVVFHNVYSSELRRPSATQQPPIQRPATQRSPPVAAAQPAASTPPSQRMQEILKIYGSDKILELVNQSLTRSIGSSAVEPPPGFSMRTGHHHNSPLTTSPYPIPPPSLHSFSMPLNIRSNSPALQGAYSQGRYSTSPLGDEWQTPLDRLANESSFSLFGSSSPYTAPVVPRPSPGPISRPGSSKPSTNVLYEDVSLFESATRSAWETADATPQPPSSVHQMKSSRCASPPQPPPLSTTHDTTMLFTTDPANLIPRVIYDDDS